MAELDKTPKEYKKEGAEAALRSMEEETGQIYVILSMGLMNLQHDLPENHPLREGISRLLKALERLREINQRYINAARTGEFDFSTNVGGACLDIHPLAANHRPTTPESFK